MSVVATNGVGFVSVETVLRHAISTLIKDFRTDPREETQWARDFLEQKSFLRSNLESQIELMVLVYCPEVPDEYIPFVVDVLSASVRLARRDKERGVSSTLRRLIRRDAPSLVA